MLYQRSSALFEEAKKVIPGGVNSPVRDFKSVGGNPVFVEKAKGAYLHDVDGNRFIDYISSWGPILIDQNTEKRRGENVPSRHSSNGPLPL